MSEILMLGLVLLIVAVLLFMLPLVRSGRYLATLPGVLILMALSTAMYVSLGSYAEITHKKEAVLNLPELSKKVLEGQSAPELRDVQDLMLALRVQAQENPRDVEGWIMLGRLGDWMGSSNYALDAFSRAYAADPNSFVAMTTFTDVLVQSGQDDMQQRAARIYNRFLEANPDAMKVRFKLAMLLMQLNRNQQAADQWQEILTRLPEGSEMRPMIEQSLQMAIDRS